MLAITLRNTYPSQSDRTPLSYISWYWRLTKHSQLASPHVQLYPATAMPSSSAPVIAESYVFSMSSLA